MTICVGDIARVSNRTPQGKVIDEGTASIIQIITYEDDGSIRALVRFKGDLTLYPRRITEDDVIRRKRK